MMLTRIATKKLNPKAIALSAICLGTVCLTSVASYLSIVPSAFAQYGLGLPKSASSGGATRGSNLIPPIILLAPIDGEKINGAKTLASQPTFLWYVNLPESTQTNSIGESPNPIEITFFLRDDASSEKVFEAKGKMRKTGLYKFTLPPDIPELAVGRMYRWQIRYDINGQAFNPNVRIRRDDDLAVVKEIANAKNDLEKARIYAKNFYWYDAIGAYNGWLSKNPKDEVASTERVNLFKIGLEKHVAFVIAKTDTKGEPIKDEKGQPILEFNPTEFAKFLVKLDRIKSAMSVELKPLKINAAVDR